MTRSLPHDPLLPHLGTALDASIMHALFASQLPCVLTACHVERVKYRPRRNVAVAYRLEGRRDDGRPFTQQVATRWCHGGEAARRHAKAQARAMLGSTAGPALTHDAQLDMVAHWWPNDAKLAAAASLADTDRLQRQWLPPVAQALVGRPVAVLEHTLTLAQVVPEHRVTARVDLLLDDGSRHTVYAKSDAEQRGPQTHAVMHALWHSPAQRGGDLLTPRPLLWQADSQLHWQAALPGRALLDLAPQVGPAHAARVGALLAGLHATPTPAERSCPLEDLRQLPLSVAAALSQAEEAWAQPAQALAQALTRRVSALALSPMVTLHGDLHPRNLLLSERGALGMIDLDSVRRGPAVLDLGAWVADALYRALLAGTDPAEVLPACHAFIEAYAQTSGERAAAGPLAWAVAYQLLCQRAWRALVNLKPGRYECIGALLDLARRVLDGGHIDAVASTTTASTAVAA
jgi:aminoglycoside phosphotransferase